MSVVKYSSGMQYEGRVTKGNASQALASLVDTIQSVEGVSPLQRVTVSIRDALHTWRQRQRLHVFTIC